MGAYTLSASRASPPSPRSCTALRSRGGYSLALAGVQARVPHAGARGSPRREDDGTRNRPHGRGAGGSRLRPAPPESRPARAGTWPIVARAPRGIPALRPCAGARQVSRIPPRSLPSGLSPARVCARLGAHSLSRSPPHTARRQSRDTAPACTAGARCLPESQGHRSTGTGSPPRGSRSVPRARRPPNRMQSPSRCGWLRPRSPSSPLSANMTETLAPRGISVGRGGEDR